MNEQVAYTLSLNLEKHGAAMLLRSDLEFYFWYMRYSVTSRRVGTLIVGSDIVGGT